MNISTVRNVKISAIGSCTPVKTIDNSAFALENFGSDMKSTIQAIGINQRKVCRKSDTTSLDLSVLAAKDLFDKAGISPQDIGGVVFVTLTPDNLMPNNASLCQYLLGLPQNIPAFDINHACSGYVYGLWIASMMASNLGKMVLLLDGDTNSHYVSPRDKSTGLLFGDAGTATILTPSNDCEWFFTFETDGSGRDSISIPGFGYRTPLSIDSLEYKTYPDGSIRRLIDMSMNGEEVFSYVVSRVPKLINNFLKEMEALPAEFNYLLIHQANAFMLRQMARRIGFDLDKIPLSIGKYGNTSSASIPLTICSELEKSLSARNKILMIGMGAGLSTGTAIIETENVFCSGVIHVDL